MMQRVRVSSYQAPVHKLGDSQITLSPKFRVAAAAAASQWSEPAEESIGGASPSLIPGLPDDIALNCLLRLPVEIHPVCRAVCRRWYALLGTKERFFCRRRELGFRDPWLFVLAFHKRSGKMEWHVLELTRLTSWHTIPAMPCRDRTYPHGFGCVANSEEGTLFVCGGMVSDVDCPLDLVLKYEMCKNRWTVMNRMRTARSFFAARAIDGFVYAAGGNSGSLFELDSAEVLDPAEENWRPIASMGVNMASYDAAVLDGKLLVTEGWIWPFLFSPRGQVYDPEANRWEAMAVGLREGWTGSSVVVYGHLFVVPEHERMRLKVYYGETDVWDAVEGPPVPEHISKPFSVNACDGRIYIVGRDLRVAIGSIKKQRFVTTSGSEGKRLWSFSVEWRAVVAPESFRDLTPSSSQVLYA